MLWCTCDIYALYIHTYTYAKRRILSLAGRHPSAPANEAITDMDKLEELLPGIDRFLRDVLGKESLSKFAKAQREYYLEKIELLRLPNTAPTRPKSVLPEPPQPTSVGKRKATNGFGCDDFIAQQRALSRLTTSEPAEPEPDVYDDVEDGPPALPEAPAPTEDDVYEVPVNLPDADGAMSDDSSGTSYESYEGEFDGDSTSVPYENVKISSANDEIRLPSDKSKKKSKKRSLRRRESKLSTAELSVENLKNVTHSGTLQIKQLLSWSKRFCVISDNCFLSYKNETDGKPVLKFLLFGCSVAHSEKDSKQQSRTHQLKITLPNGSDSYFFYADTKEVADEWVKQLNMCIGTTEIKEETKEGSSDIHLYGNIEESEETTDAQPVSPNAQACNASLSSSEGGSGDGVMAKEESAIIPDTKGSEKKTKSKVLQPGKSLSSLFGNFGKKKLEKDKKKLSMDALGIDLLEADLVGYLEITCPTCGLKKWGHRWCVLRNGVLDILNVKDNGEKVTEASFTLEGCDLGSSGDSKRSLALKLMRNKEENLVTLDFQDSIEQGKWLALLAKEVGAKTQVEHEGDASSSADGSFDSHQGAPNHTYSNFADGQVIGGGELYCNVGPDSVNAAPEGDDPMVYDEVDVSLNILSSGDDSTHTRINRMSDPPPPPPVPPPSSDDETASVKTVQRTNSNLKNRIAALQECVAASSSPKSQAKATEEGTSSKVTRRISLMEVRDAEAKESRWEPEGRPSFTPSHKKPPNEHEEKYKELKKKLDELRIRRVQVRGRKILARDPETKESYEAELQEIEKEYSKVERQMDMLVDDFGEHKLWESLNEKKDSTA